MSGFCVACGKPVAEEALRCSDCASHPDAVWAPPGSPPAGPEQGSPDAVPAGAKRGSRLFPTIFTLVIVGILSAILMPNFMRARARGQSTACKSNLKNIGTALEMYSTDNHGQFPARLHKLVPRYLKQIPTCPGAGEDSYSAGYIVGRHNQSYTVVCSGLNHSGVGYTGNYPQYTSTQGLLER